MKAICGSENAGFFLELAFPRQRYHNWKIPIQNGSQSSKPFTCQKNNDKKQTQTAHARHMLPIENRMTLEYIYDEKYSFTCFYFTYICTKFIVREINY